MLTSELHLCQEASGRYYYATRNRKDPTAKRLSPPFTNPQVAYDWVIENNSKLKPLGEKHE